MSDPLRQSELFAELPDADAERLLSIARKQHVCAGEYLFMLGSNADRLFVVLTGGIDLCFPLAIHGELKDVPVETATAGKALGWSSLVKPYRFTLSARATQGSEVASFSRRELQDLFSERPQLGYALMRRMAELVGIRLLQMQAMWARELQRAMGLAPVPQGAEASKRQEV